MIKWSIFLISIGIFICLTSCRSKIRQSQEHKTTDKEFNQISSTIDSLNQTTNPGNNNPLDTLSVLLKPKPQSALKSKTTNENKSTNYINSDYSHYGDFTYEKKSIKVRDTIVALEGSDCGNDMLFINKTGTTLTISEKKFYPTEKDEIEIQFNEYYSVSKILNSDISIQNFTDKYLGISKILSISAIHKSNKKELHLNSSKCSGNFNIFIPLSDSVENLQAFQWWNQTNLESVSSGRYYPENDSLFYRITTDNLAPVILATFIGVDKNDFKIKIKNKHWSSSIINILCYNENDGLSYTGIKLDEGSFSFPLFLDPERTILYIIFNIDGKLITCKNELSNLDHSLRKNRYIVSKKHIQK